MRTFVTLILGIIIGAGGMWFMQKSSQKTLQVDEVMESYSTPSTMNDHQGQPAMPQHAPEHTDTNTQGSH